MVKCKNCKFLSRLSNGIGEKYNWCFEIEDSPNENVERECDCYSPATNADRIRNLSDEELAEVLDDVCLVFNCDVCKHDTCISDCVFDCEETILEWLKSEVE